MDAPGDHGVRAEPRGELSLKGASRPIEAWQILGLDGETA